MKTNLIGAAQVEQLEALRRNEEGYRQEPSSWQQPLGGMQGVGLQQQRQMGSRREQAAATQGQHRVNGGGPALQDKDGILHPIGNPDILENG